MTHATAISEHDRIVLRTDLREATDALWTRAGALAALVDQQRYAEAEQLIPEVRNAIQVITLNVHTLQRSKA